MRRAPLRLRLTTGRRLRLHVDGVAYGLSPFGGLIRYWDSVLPLLWRFEIDVDLRAPAHVRAALPAIDDLAPGPGDVFVSTYFTTRADTPSLVVVHDLIYELHSSSRHHSDWKRTIDAKKEAVLSASAIVVPSEATARDLHRVYMPDVPVEVVPHGVDSIFKPVQDAGACARVGKLLERHGVTKPIVLHVGGRSAYKRFTDVLSAFALDGHLPATYQLVVAGSETIPLATEVPLLDSLPDDSVIFVGYLNDEDLAALYRASKVVVSASTAEGFGLAIAEAAACGTPVACTAIPAHMEHAGRFAATFEPRDVVGLAEAIHRAASADPASISTAARAITTRHCWDNAARAFADSVQQVANDS